MTFLLNIQDSQTFWVTFAKPFRGFVNINQVVKGLVFFNKSHKLYDSNSF